MQRSLIFLVVLLFAGVGVEFAQRTRPGYQKDKIVEFCELISAPKAYEGKVVRTTAIFAYGGEDFSELYCPACFRNGTLRPDLTESFDRMTKKKYANMISRQKHSSGSVKVEMVGELSDHHFGIWYFENAEFITKESYFPDRLSESTQSKINCQPRRK